MKFRLVVLIICLNTSFLFSQENKVVEEELVVEIDESKLSKYSFFVDIDREIFTDKTLNIYSTSDFKNYLSIAKIDVPYSSLRIEIEKDIELAQGVTILGKGEIKIEKLGILYTKTKAEIKNELVLKLTYFKAIDDKSVIRVEVCFPEIEKEIYEPIAKKAILSAELIKQ